MAPTRRSNLPALAAAIGAGLTTGGPSFAFGLYGETLKKNLGLTQSNLDTISTFFFMAGLCSWAPGLFCDRFGPRLAIVLGSSCGCLTFLGFWLTAKQVIVVENNNRASLVALLSLLGSLTFLSVAMTGSLFKVLTLVTSADSSSKGPAVGVAKGLVGLGSGVYTCIFESLKTTPHQSDLDFVALAAILFVVGATIPALLWIPSRQEFLMHAQHGQYFSQDAKPWHFCMLFATLAAMAAVVVHKSLLQLFHGGNDENENDDYDDDDDASNHESGSNDTNSSHAKDYETALTMGGDAGVDLADSGRTFPWTAVLLLLLWWGPLIVMLRSQPNHELHDDESSENNEPVQERLLTTPPATNGHDTNGHAEPPFSAAPASSPEAAAAATTTTTTTTTRAMSRRPANRNLIQMLQTPEAAWLLWSTVILVGSGTVETNNMGQMVQALGLDKSVTPASLALFSVAQAGARVGTGALQSSHPRPALFMVASAIGVMAHVLLGFATTKWTFVCGVTLAGIAFGMVWPLLVLCMDEVFGSDSFAANYMFFDGCGSALGTLFLSKWIAQSVYNAHIDHHSDSSNDSFTCLGTDCFRWTHYATAALCVTAIGSSAVFMALTRDVYETNTCSSNNNRRRRRMSEEEAINGQNHTHSSAAR